MALAAALAGPLIAGPLFATPVALGAPPTTQQRTTWSRTQAHVTPQAQSRGRYGAGVVVAVVDTWVEATHHDLAGRVLPGADCASGTCTAGLAPRDGCDPHGTHVAGIIGSSTYGIAPEVTVLPVRALHGPDEKDCTATPKAVAAAIDWAVAHGAQIINLSLGADTPGAASATEITPAIRRATDAGVLVVAAAGNDDRSSADAYGGFALVVAATGPSGRLASYSQHGTGVNLAAPGGDAPGSACTLGACVVSDWSDDRYAAIEGTSAAAPFVTGAAALLIGANPGITREQLIDRLETTAHPLTSAGHGLIDVAAALAPLPPPHRLLHPLVAQTIVAPTHAQPLILRGTGPDGHDRRPVAAVAALLILVVGGGYLRAAGSR
ncbi:MAG TPA: S8 family serine peptidase [Mycobacteriales bacterium]|nr:S8 family serine peptidase [Mycobacteriales bacterium]